MSQFSARFKIYAKGMQTIVKRIKKWNGCSTWITEHYDLGGDNSIKIFMECLLPPQYLKMLELNYNYLTNIREKLRSNTGNFNEY